MERRKGKLNKMENLLPGVAKRMGIESRLKEMMIMNYWPEIAKGDIGKDTCPYALVHSKKGSIFYVAVKSSIVVQELNMIKVPLLDKLNTLASKIGINISELVFSTKYWTEIKRMEERRTQEEVQETHEENYKSINIEAIALTEDEKQYIEETISTLSFDEEIKTRLLRVMEKDLKLKRLKKQSI